MSSGFIMLFRQLFDHETYTYSYLIADCKTKEAALVDSVIEQSSRDLQLIKELGLSLSYALETHIHADHITGASRLREVTGCLGIVPEGAAVPCADRFLEDGEVLHLGQIRIEAISTPGHTDSHLAYLVNQTHLLTGDALLIRGCGRTDFQSGDGGTLFDVVTDRLFGLPDSTLVYPGHDYRGQTVSTIGEEKAFNPRFKDRTRAEFIAYMAGLNLPDPKKIAEALPANLQCGKVAH